MIDQPTGQRSTTRRRWDVQALKSGALVSLVFAVPFSIAARWAADSQGDSTLATWFSLFAVVGFVLGAGCAAWIQRVNLPYSHAIAAAVATYAGAQAVFIAIKLIRGSDVNWFAALFNLSVVMGAGLVGGVLGQRLRSKGFLPTGSETSTRMDES